MYGLDQILGISDSMKKVRDLIGRVADSPTNILITGERGTGKELVARVIHHISGRRTGSFVPVVCSGMRESAWESDLFEEANNGTLFFDEIGELPIHLQTKLAQTLEDKKVCLAESSRSITVDVRIITSTALNLENEVKAKRFREDLYYRLNVVGIALPPLRDRQKDVPALVEAFVKLYSQEYAKPVLAISKAALYLLMNYSWPGNVRELESVVERAVTLSYANEILPGDLPVSLQQTGNTAQILSAGLKRDKTLKEVEGEYIRLILDKTHGNKYQTAEILGIDRKTLYRKLGKV